MEPRLVSVPDAPAERRRRREAAAGGVVPHLTHATLATRAVPGGADLVFHNPGDAPAGTTISDSGGDKLAAVFMQVLFWGNAWTNPATNPSAGAILNAMETIRTSGYLNGLLQYGIGGGAWVTGQPLIITSPEPPNPFANGDPGNKVWDLIDQGTFPEPDDSLYPNFYMLFMPPGVNPSNGSLGGFHTYATDTDLFDSDSLYCGWVRFSSLNGMTQLYTHELVEAMTDPHGDAIQVNPRNSTNWNEIADVCVSTAVLNGVTVASYFSAADGACIVPTPPPPPPPALPPGDYQITCIKKSSHNGVEFIWSVGGLGGPSNFWQLPEFVVVDLIQNHSCTFYVNVVNVRADIIIETSRTGHLYLKTVADGFVPNNLLSLPTCP